MLLKNHFFTGDLNNSISRFINHHDHHRYHHSLGNLTPADVYFGRGQSNLKQREKINRARSTSGACNTAKTPPNITSQASQILTQLKLQLVPNTMTADSSYLLAIGQFRPQQKFRTGVECRAAIAHRPC